MLRRPVALLCVSLLLVAGLGPVRGDPAANKTTVLFGPNLYGKPIQNDIAAELATATQTIDVAMYSFDSALLANALIAAHARGVQVRVILDSAQAGPSYSQDWELAHAGIPVHEVNTGNGAGIKFHHKFCVVDGRTLIAGSFNWTESAEVENYENCVMVRDPAIIAPFEKEFGSLWQTGHGNAASTPDVGFSPTGHSYALQERIANEIDKATKEVIIAVYEFTSSRIAYALASARKRGVPVTLLTDGNEWSVNRGVCNYLAGHG